jgi:hypothetical protein
MTKTRKKLEAERRARRRADDRKIQAWLDENKIKTKIENLNIWDRSNLLDMLNGI